METLKKIEAGSTYKMGFVTDADLKVLVQVLAVSKNFATCKLSDGIVKVKKRISWDGKEEFCLPYGSYSMAPSFGASDKVQNV